MTTAPQVTDHGGGVWSIPVPIPNNPLGHTLVYLLATDSGPVLIDTGWDDPTSWRTLRAGLAACGTSAPEVRGILGTHHHPDHHGLSGQMRDSSGAWIAMHAADTAVIRRAREDGSERWFDLLIEKLESAGAPAEHTTPMRQAREEGRTGRLTAKAAIPDREIVPGELLDLPGRRVRAIWTPGHTPGHICLHLEERHPEAERRGHGRLFSGDHLLPGVSPHIGLYEHPGEPDRHSAGGRPHPPPETSGARNAPETPETLETPETPGTGEVRDIPETGEPDGSPAERARLGAAEAGHCPCPTGHRKDPLGDYFASLERVRRLDPAEVLPAHQYAFTDAPTRVDELLDHHTQRLAGLRGLLTERPLTPWELASRMDWNRPWAELSHSSRNIAVFEAQAHLRRLVTVGEAEPVPGSDPVSYQAT